MKCPVGEVPTNYMWQTQSPWYKLLFLYLSLIAFSGLFSIAGEARKQIEQQTGRSAITGKGAAELNHVVTEMLETSADAASKTNQKKQ